MRPACVPNAHGSSEQSHVADFWADIEGSEYAIFGAHPMPRATIDAIRSAAGSAWRILSRVAPVLRAMPDDALVAMGIPATALAVCRSDDPLCGDGLMSRFDFALTPDGPKVLECNAETPFFVWESHEIGGAVVSALGGDDANAGAVAMLERAVRRVAEPAHRRLAVTAYNTWREDWFTACFAARVATAALGRPIDAVPLHELRVTDDALVDGAGCAIDVLWRFYPLEHFAADVAGSALFSLVERGRLRLINPPSSLLLQTKATLAILWDGTAREAIFNAREQAEIERYFLPTFLDPPADDALYVRKPVLGREGNSVRIVQRGRTLHQSAAHAYLDQPCVYQQYVDLPVIAGGRAIATCFVVDGQPGAVALRIGGLITDAHARFLPISISTSA